MHVGLLIYARSEFLPKRAGIDHSNQLSYSCYWHRRCAIMIASRCHARWAANLCAFGVLSKPSCMERLNRFFFRFFLERRWGFIIGIWFHCSWDCNFWVLGFVSKGL